MKPRLLFYGTLVFCLAAVILITLRSSPSDYTAFVDYTRAWMQGKTQLYSVEYNFFVYTPWTLLFLIPFTVLPPLMGMLLYNIASLVLLIWIARRAAPGAPFWSYTIALFTIYLVMYLMLGQFDVLILGALVLAGIAINEHRPWLLGVALVVATMKPTNVVLPLLIILSCLVRWPVRDILRALCLPALAFASSFLMLGIDWLPRYYRLLVVTSQFLTEIPLVTVFGEATYKTRYWDYFSPLGKLVIGLVLAFAMYLLFRNMYRARFRRIEQDDLYYALSISLVASPHFLIYHVVYLLPLIPRFVAENRAIGLLVMAATLVDLVLCYLGIGFAIFPIVVLVLMLVKRLDLKVGWKFASLRA